MSCVKHGTAAGYRCDACAEINRLSAQNDALRAQLKEASDLLWEVVRAGNSNTRALKRAIQKACPGWLADVREALSKGAAISRATGTDTEGNNT